MTLSAMQYLMQWLAAMMDDRQVLSVVVEKGFSKSISDPGRDRRTASSLARAEKT